MGNIKKISEYFTLGLQSKNKRYFAQYFFGIIYKKKILLFRGRPPFMKLVPPTLEMVTNGVGHFH
jgi:hypothetical protein